MDGKGTSLKYGVVLLLTTQEELNQLAKIVSIEEDCLHIDEPYLVFMEEVLTIIPQSELEAGHFAESIKPRKFSTWYRNELRKRK